MSINIAKAFAPATVANVAVGFDVLGFPVDGVGDTVTVERAWPAAGENPSVSISGITGVVAGLPLDASRNTAGIVLQHLIRELDLPFGFRLAVDKGIPLSSGMGGSAASSSAALVAANALLDHPQEPDGLLGFALAGEELASGSAHGDNVTPCLYGGLTILRSVNPVDVVRVPLLAPLYVALVHPHRELDTRTSRDALPAELPLRDYVAQSSRLAAFMVACCTGDFALMSRSLEDVLVEPRRARLIPAFGAVKHAALHAGALGCSISGSGPSVFALCRTRAEADKAGAAMAAAWEAAGVDSDVWVSALSQEGARIISTDAQPRSKDCQTRSKLGQSRSKATMEDV
ncbi:MAG: homoserine kinase [Spirochaetota bacterium]